MPTIAYQLYCSRNFPPLDDTLAMLAGQGWTAVEGYGGLYGDARALRDALDRHGLSMPSGHFGLSQIEDDPQGMLEAARTLGIGKVVVPWIEPDRRGSDRDSWRAFAARVAGALEPFRAEGFQTGWHNHDWDLADLGDGTTPTDLMAEAGLGIELDLGWVARAGQDPVAWLRRLGPRILAVHVKDLAPDGTAGEDGWADVGHGTQRWDAIRAELAAQGIDHWVAEHDNPADHARFARRSLETLSAW
jgi:sugar phosphate isomerase/epimerase